MFQLPLPVFLTAVDRFAVLLLFNGFLVVFFGIFLSNLFPKNLLLILNNLPKDKINY